MMRLILCFLLLFAVGCQSETGGAISALTLAPTEVISVAATPLPDRRMEFVYQEFERGFMLWDVAKQCAYAYQYGEGNGIIIPESLDDEYSLGNAYTYCLPEPKSPRSEPNVRVTATSQIPERDIGIIWKAYPEVQDGVGFATGEQQSYIGFVPYDNPAAIMISCCNVAVLPDNRVLFCGHHARSAGTCYIPEKRTSDG